MTTATPQRTRAPHRYTPPLSVRHAARASHTNGGLYAYAANSPVCYTDPDGWLSISVIVNRDINSKYSATDRQFRCLDTITFKNNETGEIFNLYNVQTYVSFFTEDGSLGYPVGNTLEAYMGGFEIQYLGNNGEGEALFGGYASNYKGPVFNVCYAHTKGLGITDGSGRIIGDSDQAPIRVHSNFNLTKGAEVQMASGGCIMYHSEQIDAFAAFLQRAGMKKGDSLFAYIKEYFEP